MESHQICRSLLVGAAVVALGAAPLAAQNKAVRISKTGQVVGLAPGIIQAKADGKFYNLKINKEKNVVTVTGNLALAQLQRGMLVRCTGPLKGNAIEGDVAEVKVFGAGDGYQFGVLQDAPDQPATVTGQLAKLKDNQLTIAAGRRNISVRLAEGATVVVDTKDYSVVRGGESVQFDGTVAADGITVGCRKIVVTITPASEKAKTAAKKKTSN